MNKLLIFPIVGMSIFLIGLIFVILSNDVESNDVESNDVESNDVESNDVESNDVESNDNTITNIELNFRHNSSVLELVGKTTNVDQEIGFLVYSPDGVLIFADTSFANSDGEFKSVITTGGPIWKQVGNFTFAVQQGDELYPDNSRTFEMTEEMIQGRLDFMYNRTP